MLIDKKNILYCWWNTIFTHCKYVWYTLFTKTYLTMQSENETCGCDL